MDNPTKVLRDTYSRLSEQMSELMAQREEISGRIAGLGEEMQGLRQALAIIDKYSQTPSDPLPLPPKQPVLTLESEAPTATVRAAMEQALKQRGEGRLADLLKVAEGIVKGPINVKTASNALWHIKNDQMAERTGKTWRWKEKSP